MQKHNLYFYYYLQPLNVDRMSKTSLLPIIIIIINTWLWLLYAYAYDFYAKPF